MQVDGNIVPLDRLYRDGLLREFVDEPYHSSGSDVRGDRFALTGT